MRMRLLRFMLLPILCLTLAGCTESPADKAVSADNAKLHLSRGGPRNGHPWVVYPDVLAKWVGEIPEIAKGTPADEVIRRLGEPDLTYVNAPELSWSPHADRIATYYVAMDRTDKNLPLSPASLACIESINLVFDSDGRYKSYWVDNPLHVRNDAPPDADQDLTSLLHAGPAATAP